VLDGLSVLKAVRSEEEMLPVLILSAKGTSEDKVRGLRFGVDDYLSKPFDLEEFLLGAGCRCLTGCGRSAKKSDISDIR
jgi:DNA-binding response OmpR family regulator